MEPFDAEAVSQIADYMNEHQAEANLRIVQVHGATPEATEARLVDVGDTVARFAVETPDGPTTVDVAWPRTLSRREQIRDELIGLYMSAG